jgi:fatty acid desaturase
MSSMLLLLMDGLGKGQSEERGRPMHYNNAITRIILIVISVLLGTGIIVWINNEGLWLLLPLVFSVSLLVGAEVDIDDDASFKYKMMK